MISEVDSIKHLHTALTLFSVLHKNPSLGAVRALKDYMQHAWPIVTQDINQELKQFETKLSQPHAHVRMRSNGKPTTYLRATAEDAKTVGDILSALSASEHIPLDHVKLCREDTEEALDSQMSMAELLGTEAKEVRFEVLPTAEAKWHLPDKVCEIRGVGVPSMPHVHISWDDYVGYVLSGYSQAHDLDFNDLTMSDAHEQGGPTLELDTNLFDYLTNHPDAELTITLHA